MSDRFPGGGATVEQARRRLMGRVMAGDKVDCPCCGQRAALYPRRINQTMAAQLAKLVEHGGWLQAREIELGVTSGDRDFHKLRFWGLVVGDGASNWLATPNGKKFVAGSMTVPATMFIYDNEPVASSKERVSFADCLRQPFDLFEVLGKGRAA
jgi:hypothetical protein